MELHERLDCKSIKNKWYKYIVKVMVIKQEGEANTQPKRGDTLVKQGDMQGAVVGYK